MSFPRYPEYKDSGVKWLGEVPAHWALTKLKNVARFSGGGTPSRDNPAFWSGHIPWVSPKDMKSERISGAEEFITDAGLSSSTSNLVPPGKLLMVVRSGILKHTIPVAVNEVEVALNQDMKALDFGADSSLSPFFQRWVQGLNDSLLLEWAKQGATVESIEHAYLAETVLPMPPPEERTRICEVLDRETAKIDALVAEQEMLITLLKEKRQAVISHAVTKGLDPTVPMKDSGVEWLGEVPAHWETMRVKDCGCEVVDCKNRTPEPHADGDYFVVRTSCVKDGQFSPDPGYWTDEANFIEWTAKGRPLAGDVLFTREAPTGEACLAPEGLDFCLGQRMMYIRPPEGILLSEFLLYSIYGGLARERISEKSKGSTVGHLRVGEVGELPLLLPPLDEQHDIIGCLNEELSKLQKLAAESERAISLMSERRSALISAAVTGQIDVSHRA